MFTYEAMPIQDNLYLFVLLDKKRGQVFLHYKRIENTEELEIQKEIDEHATDLMSKAFDILIDFMEAPETRKDIVYIHYNTL